VQPDQQSHIGPDGRHAGAGLRPAAVPSPAADPTEKNGLHAEAKAVAQPSQLRAEPAVGLALHQSQPQASSGHRFTCPVRLVPGNPAVELDSFSSIIGPTHPPPALGCGPHPGAGHWHEDHTTLATHAARDHADLAAAAMAYARGAAEKVDMSGRCAGMRASVLSAPCLLQCRRCLNTCSQATSLWNCRCSLFISEQ
jgi:hypothetical protein